ncbi:MAG TPA: glycosyltransferase family 39 protein [Solirubrobacterales bacterium]|nr:glycosyltransferase family 39 protein [Solirubrobacterales bacterium]
MASEFAARNGGRVGVAALIAILLLGLGLRLHEAWDGRAPVYDAAAYAAIAANLERGEGFTVGPSATQPSSNYSPGLPLFVAGTYELTGGVHERTARVVLALIGTLSILFTYAIGRRLRSPAAGLIGAGCVAIYPALLEYQGMLMSEPLAATLLSASVLSLLWAGGVDRSRPSRGCPEGGGPRTNTSPAGSPPSGRAPRATWLRWLLPGLLLGATAMVRPEYLGIAALLALVVFARTARADWRRGLAQAAIVLAGVALVVLPWTVRNMVALDRAVPISTGGGQVLFAGTYLPSDGDPERVGAEVVERHPELFGANAVERLRLEQILTRLAAQRYPDLETDQALSRMGKDQLWDDLSGQPLEYAGFVATKVWRVWSQGPREVMEEPLWRAFQLVLVVLGLLGLGLLAWRRRWEALVLATVFLGVTALSAVLVASPRRVLVLVPLVAALAGVAATWVADRLSPGRT